MEKGVFIEWFSSILKLSKGQVIAVDGKTLRGEALHGEKSPVDVILSGVMAFL